MLSRRTFPAQHLHFIPYKPKPKPTSLRKLSKKVPPNEDKYAGIGDILGSRPGSNTGRRDKEDPGLTPHGVKVIDLTCFVGEGVYFSPMYGHSILGFEHYVSREVTSDESLSQPAPSEDGSQENAVVIEGGQPELGTDDDDCLLKDDMGMQIGDQLEDSSICPNATEDAIHSEAVNGAGTHVNTANWVVDDDYRTASARGQRPHSPGS